MLNPQQQSTFIFVSHCRLEALGLSYRAVSLHCLSSWQQGRKSRILILYGYQTDNPGSLGRMDTGHRPWQPYHLPTITAQSPHRSGGKLCLTSFAAQERSTSGMQCDNCHGQSPRACKRRPVSCRNSAANHGNCRRENRLTENLKHEPAGHGVSIVAYVGLRGVSHLCCLLSGVFQVSRWMWWERSDNTGESISRLTALITGYTRFGWQLIVERKIVFCHCRLRLWCSLNSQFWNLSFWE